MTAGPYPGRVDTSHRGAPPTPSADLGLVGGEVADVRAGMLRRAAVAITGDRVSAIGPDDAIAPLARRLLDVHGGIIVPGYIEPHTHIVLANPVEFAQAVLPGGTTLAVADALPFMLLARREGLAPLLERLAGLPMKLRWLIRLHPQSFTDDDEFPLEWLRGLWRLPSAAAVGEVTRWVDVLDGDPDLRAKIRAAAQDGKRIEGHAPGASYARLAALAAAGVTSCHEAITADEVTDRLRAGLFVMLRHSSIRPDLPQLSSAVTPHAADARLMLTADGPSPALIAERGYMDHVLTVAIRSGIPPLLALRMVTLNPATYFGFADMGEIAVGRRADLNVIADLSHPRPTLVIADGRVVAQDGRLLQTFPGVSWQDAMKPAHLPRLPPEALLGPGQEVPTLRLINDVITEAAPADEVPEALHLVLLHRQGRWMARARLAGLADRVGGLATTLTSGFDPVVIGRDARDMARALHRLARQGGGLVMVEDGEEIFNLGLELGVWTARAWADVVEANRRFVELMRRRGYRYGDPVVSLLFLTFDSLPWIRITARGVWDVRARKVLSPSTPLP